MIDIIMHNKIIIQGIPKPLKIALIKNLTFINPKWADAVKYRRWAGNIPRFIKDYEEDGEFLIVPRGLFKPLISTLEKNNLTYKLLDTRLYFKPINIGSKIKLRESQVSIAKAIEGKEQGVIVAPPGSGKTVLGMYLVSQIGQPALWITHTNKLFNQAIERAEKFLNVSTNEIGRIRQKELIISNKLTVAMLQTLYSRDLSDIVNHFGVVILDEVHHLPAQSFLTVVTKFPSKYMFGLTATDYRKDGLEKIIFQNIGPVLYRLIHEEVKEEVLTPQIIKVYTGIQFVYEDGYYQKLVTDITRNETRNQLISYQAIEEAKKGNACIILSGRVNHCKTLKEMIEKHMPVRIAVGKNRTEKENEEAVRDVEEGKSNILVATSSLLSEGFDCPKLNRLFLATPIKSKVLYVQSVGRILRQAPGKTDAIVYDYIDDNSLLFSQANSREFYALDEWSAKIKEIDFRS